MGPICGGEFVWAKKSECLNLELACQGGEAWVCFSPAMKVIQRRASALFAQLSAVLRTLSQQAEPQEVHHLRTSARRLESALAWVRPEMTAKQLATVKELEGLRRRAGKIRDCDIQLGLLEGPARGSARADRDVVANALRDKRRQQARRLIADVSDFLASKSPYRLGKVAAALHAKLGPMVSDLPLVNATSALESLRRTSRSQDWRSARRLHRLRLSLKQIRYVAELARSSAKQKAFVANLKEVQDEIGRWHDWESLARTARKPLKDRANCPLLAEIDALRSSHQQHAIAAAKRLLHDPAPGRKNAQAADAPQRVKAVS